MLWNMGRDAVKKIKYFRFLNNKEDRDDICILNGSKQYIYYNITHNKFGEWLCTPSGVLLYLCLQQGAPS